MLQALVDALRGLLALFGLVQEKRTLIIVGACRMLRRLPQA